MGESEINEALSLDKCREEFIKWPNDHAYAASNSETDKMIKEKIAETRIKRLDYFRRVEEYAENIDVF